MEIWTHKKLKKVIYLWLAHEKDPKTRQRLGYMLEILKDAETEIDDLVEETAAIYGRYPEFPGDEVGRLPDDWDDDDDV